MFEKIIDKVFAKKAVEELRYRTAIMRYDKKTVKLKDRYEYYVKSCRASEYKYEKLLDIYFNNGIDMYIRIATSDMKEILEVLKGILQRQEEEMLNNDRGNNT